MLRQVIITLRLEATSTTQEGGHDMDEIDDWYDDWYVTAGLLDHALHEAANRVEDDSDPDDREHPALSCDHPGRTGP